MNYQNDLMRANNEMTNYLQGRVAAEKNASQKGILEKAADLRKKGDDLQKSAQEVQKAVELGLGSTFGPKVVNKLVKPIATSLSETKVGRFIGSKITNARQGVNNNFFNRGSESRLSGDRAVRGEEAEGDRPVPGSQDLEEVKPGVWRARDTARTGRGLNTGRGQNVELGKMGKNKGEDVEVSETKSAQAEATTENAANDANALVDAEKGATGTEEAATVVEGGLEATAAADAWNPVGWILGAGLAVTAIVEGVESGNDNAAAQQQQHLADAVQLPKSPPVNFAGKLVVPVSSAVAQE